jgi:hypothetical protein
VKRGLSPESGKSPDLGPITPKIIELYDRALAGKADVQEKIRHYSSKPSPNVRDQLTLAWLRNWLRILDPRLPDEGPPTAVRVWRYWINHPVELRKLTSADDAIMSYLLDRDKVKAAAESMKLQLFELINQDKLTLLALHPVVEELCRKKRGRPITQGSIAVRALQLQIDNNWTWTRITSELCDCGRVHDKHCKERIRQSVLALEKLLGKCRSERP